MEEWYKMDYMGMAEKRAAEAKSDLIGWMYKSDPKIPNNFIHW